VLIVFVILGTVTLAASIVGLIGVGPGGRSAAPLHVICLALLGAAAWSSHETTTGRVCLFAAAGIEAIRWLASKKRVKPVVDSVPGYRTIGAGEDPVRAARSSPAASPSHGPSAAKTAAARSQPDDAAYLAEAWSPEAGEIAAARAKATGTIRSTVEEAQPDAITEPAPAERWEDEGGDVRMTKPPAQRRPGDDVGADLPTPPTNTVNALPPSEQELPRLTLRTQVLFSRDCSVAPGVFVASLRRTGRRDAAAVEGDTLPRIRIGDVVLEFDLQNAPRDPAAIEETLTYFEHSAEFADAIRVHAAHVTLTSHYPAGSPRDFVVRVHHHAHAALTEFTPVVCTFWPDARMLTPVDQLAGLLEYARSAGQAMWRTCAHIRGFALSGDNEGMLLFDSVGLLAFGLPDVQVIAPASHEAAARKAIDLIAERIFISGCDLPHGTEYSASDGLVWRVNYTRSAFVPDREVVQLALKT